MRNKQKLYDNYIKLFLKDSNWTKREKEPDKKRNTHKKNDNKEQYAKTLPFRKLI